MNELTVAEKKLVVRAAVRGLKGPAPLEDQDPAVARSLLHKLVLMLVEEQRAG